MSKIDYNGYTAQPLQLITSLHNHYTNHCLITIVNKHFKVIQKIFGDNEIPLCNLWNGNEISIQIGGGHKNKNELFLFSSANTSTYKLNSEDLKLVMIIKTICTDGTASIHPCFIFSGTQQCKEWYNAPNSDSIL